MTTSTCGTCLTAIEWAVGAGPPDGACARRRHVALPAPLRESHDAVEPLATR